MNSNRLTIQPVVTKEAKLVLTRESMVTLTVSIINKSLNRQQITRTTRKIEFSLHAYTKMSEAETQSAVDHIPDQERQNEFMSDICDDATQSVSDKQARLVYDPVNNTYTQATVTGDTRDVGERRRDIVITTGKKKAGIECKGKVFNPSIFCYIGTESLVTNTSPNDIAGQQLGTVTTSSPQQQSLTPVSNNQHSDKELNTSEETAVSQEATTPTHLTPPCSSHSCTENDSEVTDEFSSSSGSEQQPNKKPQHEQIDHRIKLQKETFWKKMGKNSDPRIAALVPIHAPKMERLSRLQALQQRALSRPKAKEGDILTGIMHEISKTAEINSSIVPVGAEFIMEKELGSTSNREVVKATNSPLTTRPKPPQQKHWRKNKVIPFPGRKKQADQDNGKKKEDQANESVTGSDASWPTDQDESIPSFRKQNVRRKRVQKPSAKKKKEKQTKKKAVVKKPKKLTKAAITAMIYKIRDPMSMTTWDDSLKLDNKRTRKLVRDQKIRMRQRESRAQKKHEKLNKANEPQHDVLAQAINLTNIWLKPTMKVTNLWSF